MVQSHASDKKAAEIIKTGKQIKAIPKTEGGIVKQIKSLADNYKFSASIIAEILDVSPKTFSRYQENAKGLSTQQKDRIEIVEVILATGKRVLGTEEEVRRWLYRPVHSIENQRPIDLIVSESGRRRVENVLLQLEGGAY
jgi:putative toxin-antitoxin system antitoxin component (TIGR02293 family)